MLSPSSRVQSAQRWHLLKQDMEERRRKVIKRLAKAVSEADGDRPTLEVLSSTWHIIMSAITLWCNPTHIAGLTSTPRWSYNLGGCLALVAACALLMP